MYVRPRVSNATRLACFDSAAIACAKLNCAVPTRVRKVWIPDWSSRTILSASQYRQRTRISSGPTVSGAPHCRQFGGSSGDEGKIAAKDAPTREAPLTSTFLKPTFAATICARTSGSQTQIPTNDGSTVLFTVPSSPTTRTTRGRQPAAGRARLQRRRTTNLEPLCDPAAPTPQSQTVLPHRDHAPGGALRGGPPERR